jgi:hypothetical protein
VSSSKPSDLQPSSQSGLFASPRIASNTFPLPPGKGYIPVGTKRAFDSDIDLPSKSTSASWMLGFAMPLDVSKSFTESPNGLDRASQVAEAKP